MFNYKNTSLVVFFYIFDHCSKHMKVFRSSGRMVIFLLMACTTPGATLIAAFNKDTLQQVILYETDHRESVNQKLQESNALNEQIIANQRRFVFLSGTATFAVVFLLVILWISRKKLLKQNRDLEAMHRQIIHKQFEISKKNAKLDEQKRELEQLNHTKDKLFSIIAHDLRAPFHSLLGYLGILSDDFDQLDKEEKQNMVKELHRLSHATYGMITNLLEWAAVQRGVLRTNPGNTPIGQVVDESIMLLKQNFDGKDQQIINQVPAGLTSYADPKLLRSVLVNLINNAVKFSPRGGKIRVEAIMNGSIVKICIRDYGVGIPADKIGSLFELSSDYRRHGTENEQGTGLGLITVKEIVTLMGGKVQVESQEGNGSRFCVFLPAEKQ